MNGQSLKTQYGIRYTIYDESLNRGDPSYPGRSRKVFDLPAPVLWFLNVLPGRSALIYSEGLLPNEDHEVYTSALGYQLDKDFGDSEKRPYQPEWIPCMLGNHSSLITTVALRCAPITKFIGPFLLSSTLHGLAICSKHHRPTYSGNIAFQRSQNS